MNRSVNSSFQLTLGAVWRHTVVVGSEPVSTVATRLSPIRWTARARFEGAIPNAPGGRNSISSRWSFLVLRRRRVRE